jgi:hypothetical protein
MTTPFRNSACRQGRRRTRSPRELIYGIAALLEFVPCAATGALCELLDL